MSNFLTLQERVLLSLTVGKTNALLEVFEFCNSSELLQNASRYADNFWKETLFRLGGSKIVEMRGDLDGSHGPGDWYNFVSYYLTGITYHYIMMVQEDQPSRLVPSAHVLLSLNNLEKFNVFIPAMLPLPTVQGFCCSIEMFSDGGNLESERCFLFNQELNGRKTTFEFIARKVRKFLQSCDYLWNRSFSAKISLLNDDSVFVEDLTIAWFSNYLLLSDIQFDDCGRFFFHLLCYDSENPENGEIDEEIYIYISKVTF